MNVTEFRHLVRTPKKAEESGKSWGRIPSTAWNQLHSDVAAVFCPQAIFLFTEAVYRTIFNEPKYPKPPKGVLPED